MNVEKQIVGTENDFAGAVDVYIGKIIGTETVDRLRAALTWVGWGCVREDHRKEGREEDVRAGEIHLWYDESRMDLAEGVS